MVVGATAVTAATAAGTLSGVFSAPGTARAQDVSGAAPSLPGITVVGDGSVRVRPDSATLSLGVEASAPTAAAALGQAQAGAERVLQRMRELGVAEEDLQTSGLNVFPVQGGGREPVAPAPGPGAPPTTYRGFISVTVRVADARDPQRVAQLLDAAVQAGATTVQGLSFGVRDTRDLQRQSIAAAIADSRPKAESAAVAAGLQLGGVRAVVEQPGAAGLRAGFGGGAAESIAPGTSEVAVRVLVTYNVTG